MSHIQSSLHDPFKTSIMEADDSVEYVEIMFSKSYHLMILWAFAWGFSLYLTRFRFVMERRNKHERLQAKTKF